jgi:glycosyltransferase involved in cell wall biosynthesis
MSEQSLTVLCLSFRTPPLVRPQSILIGKMIQEWIRKKVKPIIVTYSDNGNWDVDAPIITIDPPKTLPKWLRIVGGQVIYEYLYCRMIRNRLVRIIDTEKPDVIFSFSNPAISNLVGAMLQHKTGVPFVSHFSDPWYDQGLVRRTIVNKIKIRLQEKFSVIHSNAVVFPNETLKNLVMKKYPQFPVEKQFVIPHCFDSNAYSKEKFGENSLFSFGHIGAFYPQRTPDPLFKAAALLQQSNANFRLVLVGPLMSYSGYSQEMLDQLIEKYELIDKVEIHPPVSYEESLKLMQSMDVLVVIDADIQDSPFLPSKLVDYAGSRTPVIGITPEGSPTSDFLNEVGYTAFNYKQIDEFADCMKALIEGRITLVADNNAIEKYNVSSTTDKLMKIFKEVVGK